MAFRKFANASVISSDLNFDKWDEVRHRATEGSLASAFESRKAAKVVLQEFSPKDFLLTHITIIASVDAETSQAPLGKQMVDGFQIDRKYGDWLITPETTKYVNNNCFVPGTMILMADGTEKPIEDVHVGDLVISHTGETRRVTETFIHPFKGMLRSIKRLGDPRSLNGTSEHPFFAMTPATTCACGCGTALNRRHRRAAVHRFQDFVQGHGARPRAHDKPDYTWISAGLLDRGDFLSMPRLQGEAIPQGVTPGKARLLGYYLAEGFYHRQKAYRVAEKYREGDGSVPVSVNFALALDEKDTLVAKIRGLLQEEFGVGSTVARVSEGGVTVYSQQSLELVHFFREHATEYAGTKRLLPSVLQWPVALQREIVQGWMEGDGCVESTAGGWICMASASANLVSQMHVLLGRMGVFASRSRRGAQGRKRVRVSNGGVQVVNDPTKTCVTHTLQVGSIEAEKIVGGSFLNDIFRRSTASRRKHSLSFRVRDDRMMFPIRSSTKKAYEGKVYNFETEIDHSYVANGVAVHNSDAWERKLLLACFRTFIGGENYVEHIQIPEMSKGKIIDAAARDVGDSIYVDLLIATNRRHKPLVAAITSKQLSTLSMGCFLPGTPVTMADGTRLPIEEVRPGAMVLTHKGRAREVLNQQIRGGRWQMRRIKVKGVPDSIEATGTHPFFVLRPAIVCGCGCGEPLPTKDADPVRRMMKRFKSGHDKRILNPNGVYSLDDFKARQDKIAEIQSLKVEKVRADELQVGDYLIFPKLDTDLTGDPGTAKARLLGYFLAEGSFLKCKGVPTAVQFDFSLTEKGTFVQEVVSLLRDEFPGCAPWVQDREDRNTSTVHVSGKDIAAWFKHHGGEYSHQKRLSPEATQWSVESQKHLLGAWLNGDGHLHGGGHAVGTTTSYDLGCQLHTLAIRCGIPVWMDCVFGGRTVTVSEAVVNGQFLRHDETGKLAAFNVYFPQSSSMTLRGVTAKAPRDGSHKKHQHLRSLDDKVIFPITEIEPFTYEGWVHDIEVDEDHSYQVHGFGVSNCQVEFTTCTKCGNVAYDETQLCNHIRYFKGNDWIDEWGKKRKIAELCGHISDEPGSVKFIEASWVANPAFTGAVLRSILTAEEQEMAGVGTKMAIAFSEPPRIPNVSRMAKAAFATRGAQGEQGQGVGEPEAPADPPKDADPMTRAVDDLGGLLREKAIEKVRGEINKDEAGPVDENRNDSLIKSAMRHPTWVRIGRAVLASVGGDPRAAKKLILGMILYRSGGWKAVQASGAFRGREILALSRVLDTAQNRRRIAGENRLYKVVLAVGGLPQDTDAVTYLRRCREVMGREITDSERSALITKGRLYASGL